MVWPILVQAHHHHYPPKSLLSYLGFFLSLLLVGFPFRLEGPLLPNVLRKCPIRRSTPGGHSLEHSGKSNGLEVRIPNLLFYFFILSIFFLMLPFNQMRQDVRNKSSGPSTETFTFRVRSMSPEVSTRKEETPEHPYLRAKTREWVHSLGASAAILLIAPRWRCRTTSLSHILRPKLRCPPKQPPTKRNQETHA